MTNIRPKISVDYEVHDLLVRLVIAPDDEYPESTILHEKVLTSKTSRPLFSIPNSSLDDLIDALIIYRDNLRLISQR